MKREIRVWLDEVKRAERAKGQMSDERKTSLTERLELHIAELKAGFSFNALGMIRKVA